MAKATSVHLFRGWLEFITPKTGARYIKFHHTKPVTDNPSFYMEFQIPNSVFTPDPQKILLTDPDVVFKPYGVQTETVVGFNQKDLR